MLEKSSKSKHICLLFFCILIVLITLIVNVFIQHDKTINANVFEQSCARSPLKIILNAENNDMLEFRENLKDPVFSSKSISNESFLNTSSINTTTNFMPEYNKFIFTDFMWGRLGNQMYRFASLYGIGKLIQRTPVFLKNEVTVHNLQSEVKSVFPYFSERLIYYQKDYAYLCPSFVHKVKFAADCCEYVDPSIKNLNSHTICVHTRRTDFPEQWRSTKNNTEKALDSALNYLKQAHNNFSLLMIGEDKEFLDTINYPTDIKYVNNFTEMPRAEEMCLAVELCDSLVITAPFSTFAFWIGYLMKQSSKIFLCWELQRWCPLQQR